MSTTELVNDTRLTDLNKTVRALGTQSANSALAKPKMALAIVQARMDGVIDDNAGEATYNTYMEGRRKVLSTSLLGSGAEDGGSQKANVSKNTQLLKAAGLITAGIDFAEVLSRATQIRDDAFKADEKVKPTFEAYVDIARAQLKAPTAALTDDELSVIVRKPAKAEKELVDKLISAYKTARKLQDDFAIPAMAEVCDGYAKAIEEAGGEVPAVGDEEKATAEVMNFASTMSPIAKAKLLKALGVHVADE